MILIADSGSTKTSWRTIDLQKNILQFETQGINPYFLNTEKIKTIIEAELLIQLKTPEAISEIHFYGAGCRAEDKKRIVADALLSVFKTANVQIESDLLGAAHSLCGRSAGLVAILGTGMNSCYYDGNTIVENRTSAGFILGDEGSGAYLGKVLIQAYLNDQLPENILRSFNERFKLSKDEIIDAVYRQPLPNRFLASFSKFIYQNLKDQFMVDLVSKSFALFFDLHICKYQKHKELKLNCTGSVAFYFSNILRSVAEDKGVNIHVITENPIAGLTLYHLGEE